MESAHEREEKVPEAIAEYVAYALRGVTQSEEEYVDVEHFEIAASIRKIPWNRWQLHIWKRSKIVNETNRVSWNELLQIIKIITKKKGSNCTLMEEIWLEARYYEQHKEVCPEDAVKRFVSFKSMRKDTNDLVHAAKEAEILLQKGGEDSRSIKESITQKARLWKQLLEWDSSKEEKTWYDYQKLKKHL
ncbi:hypothetical protein CRE_12368 [Caenorhabditis remanei]|uniref:Uncharacterized protein n=1 Tax=Caenorhabditis remanei TaxID=31234 RepID=E3NK60_CAERE|nr:hypothetical protein CRE_12368 [Caenorhabditis remanei]